ncbi:hypothetical protein [Streptomyces sp. HPF1205]|uniref:hypothetical protein n=1 Tax=Streptomyces sp. HPF1205 TaxID=2873262 RepID=UPI001CED3B72|nr:hypothetical protein [Streptomyces sp. HPF1205]
MSHSDSRAVPAPRRAAAPGATGAAPGGPPPGRRRREPPNREPREPAGAPVTAALTRAAELSACCVTSLVVSFLLMGCVAGLAFVAYQVLG